MKQRKINKIVLCAHSLGSFLAGYFINKYPLVIDGYINVTGIANQWTIGMLTFYRLIVVSNKFNQGS